MASWAKVIRNHVMETFNNWDEPCEGFYEGSAPLWATLVMPIALFGLLTSLLLIMPSIIMRFANLEYAYISYPRIALILIPGALICCTSLVPVYYRNVRKTIPTNGQIFPFTASIWLAAIVLVTSPVVAVAMGARMKAAGYESCMGRSGTDSMHSSTWVHPPLTCRDVWKMDYDELREVKRAEG